MCDDHGQHSATGPGRCAWIPIGKASVVSSQALRCHTALPSVPAPGSALCAPSGTNTLQLPPLADYPLPCAVMQVPRLILQMFGALLTSELGNGEFGEVH